MLRPVLHENFLYLFVVFFEFVLDLLGPHDGAGLHGHVAHIADLKILSLDVALQEFLVEQVDAFLDGLQQLGLVLLDGRFYPRPEEKSVEFAENAEHFIGVG